MSETPSKIIQRIAAKTGIPDLASILAGLPASDLQSLLLHIYQCRAEALGLPGVCVVPIARCSSLLKTDGRSFNEDDRVAFELAQGFEAVDLAPVYPLGLNHVLVGIDQNNVLTSIRSAEVLGDAAA